MVLNILAVFLLCGCAELAAAPVRPDIEPDTEAPPDDLVCEARIDAGVDGLNTDRWTGRFGGIGIELQPSVDALLVGRPIAGGPAEKAGIQAGDQITKINDEFTYGLGFDECVKKMRGEPGSAVTLTVYRAPLNETNTLAAPSAGGAKKSDPQAAPETRQCRIVRSFVRISTVRNAQILAGKVGYLHIVAINDTSPSFTRFTSAEVRETVEQLGKNGACAWVIDLRGNKGGLLRSARDVASRFLEPAQLVFMLRDPLSTHRQEFLASRLSAHTSGPLAVLINGGTAGAAEVVAGSWRVQHRAVLIGGPTFGLGRVVRLMPNQDGTATAADAGECLLPNGTALMNRPLTPDIDMSNEANMETPMLQRNFGRVEAPWNVAQDPVVQRAVLHCLGQLGITGQPATP